MGAVNRWAAMAVLGVAFAALPVTAESRADERSGDSSTASIPPAGQEINDGAFELLSAGNRKIALALFDAQGGSIGSDVAWTLDEIAAAKISGTAWSEMFERMRAEGLIEETNLGAVISVAVRKWNTRAPNNTEGNGAPEARRGAYKSLPLADREIAEALFESQSIGPAGRQAWSLDQIGTERQNGAGWAKILKRMRADGLIQARSLDRVIQRHARLAEPAKSNRKVVVTNGAGSHVVVTTQSRSRNN